MTLSAVLLTGGESRRMGTDKATLIYEGIPLWHRQLDLLRTIHPETIFISARTKPAWCPPDAVVVLDEPPSHGPLSGLVAVLNCLRTTHLLALAVDLPHMTADHLQSLWRLAGRGRGVIPQPADYFEPLCAIYPAEACILAGESLAAGRYSLQSLAHALTEKGLMHPHPLKAVELPLYHNTNRPEDLKSAS